MTGPIVELLVAPGTGERLRPLLPELGRWCDPRASDAALPDPSARLASSWNATGVADALEDSGRPLAVWVASTTDRRAGAHVLDRCRTIVTDDPGVAEHFASRAVLMADSVFALRPVPPLTPFVRARWRRRLGFPSDFVADVRPNGKLPEPALVPTALALCGAAVVTQRWLEDALALGTPVVTDELTALRAGATHDREVVVWHDEPLAQARALASDLPRAAALGRAGRRLVERNEQRAPVAELAHRLGLTGGRGDARTIVDSRLAELTTPPFSRVAMRARTAVAPFLPTASLTGAER